MQRRGDNRSHRQPEAPLEFASTLTVGAVAYVAGLPRKLSVAARVTPLVVSVSPISTQDVRAAVFGGT